MTEQSGMSLLFENADFYKLSEINTPTSILSEKKAKMTTNELINKPSIESPISTQEKQQSNLEVFQTFLKSFVVSNYETMNDILDKPMDKPLFTHVNDTINKDNRKLYVGLLLILIAMFFFS